MPVPEEEMIVETRDYIVSEHIFNPKATVAEVEAYIKANKSTANVKLTFNQGGRRRCVAEERTEIDERDSNEVRRLIGMDYEVEITEEEAKGLEA